MSAFVAGTGVWLRVPLAPQPTEEEVLVDPLHVELQGQTNWCWAAVGSAVARHYDPATRFARQCDVANEATQELVSHCACSSLGDRAEQIAAARSHAAVGVNVSMQMAPA